MGDRKNRLRLFMWSADDIYGASMTSAVFVGSGRRPCTGRFLPDVLRRHASLYRRQWTAQLLCLATDASPGNPLLRRQRRWSINQALVNRAITTKVKLVEAL